MKNDNKLMAIALVILFSYVLALFFLYGGIVMKDLVDTLIFCCAILAILVLVFFG